MEIRHACDVLLLAYCVGRFHGFGFFGKCMSNFFNRFELRDGCLLAVLEKFFDFAQLGQV